MSRIAALLVLLAGTYLVGLGITAFIRPDRTKRFLAAFASSARVHFLEMALRITVGTAFILAAPQMRFAELFRGFGWILVGTSIALLAVPWRLHRRFALWSVPQATRNMPLLGAGSLIGGILLLVALLSGRGTG